MYLWLGIQIKVDCLPGRSSKGKDLVPNPSGGIIQPQESSLHPLIFISSSVLLKH